MSGNKEEDKFARGVRLFNRQKFFEAHEAWEELWLAEAEPEKTFLQGLIQVAAAFHHWQRGNMRGANSLLAAAVAKLEGFAANHRRLAVGELRTELERWARVLRGKKNVEFPQPPQIRLGKKKQIARPHPKARLGSG